MSTNNNNTVEVAGAPGGSYFIPIRPAQAPSQASPSNPAASPSNPPANPPQPSIGACFVSIAACFFCLEKPSKPFPFTCKKHRWKDVEVCEDCCAVGMRQVHEDTCTFLEEEHPIVKCSFCSKDTPLLYTCAKKYHGDVYVCDDCAGSGLIPFHEDMCFKGKARYKQDGVSKNFWCSCNPRRSPCSNCVTKKASKYICFHCRKEPSTIACKCLNYFFCSKECENSEYMPQFQFEHEKHNHAMLCGKLPVVCCGHGFPLVSCTLGCTICYHGLWDQDCYLCLSDAMAAVDNDESAVVGGSAVADYD
jgi:hypothetical protein